MARTTVAPTVARASWGERITVRRGASLVRSVRGACRYKHQNTSADLESSALRRGDACFLQEMPELASLLAQAS